MAPALQDPEAASTGRTGPTGPGQVSAASNSTCVPCTWSPCLPPLRTGPSVAGGNTRLSLRTARPGDTGTKGARQSPGIGPSVQPRGPAVLSPTGPGEAAGGRAHGLPSGFVPSFWSCPGRRPAAQEAATKPGPCVKGRTALVGAWGHSACTAGAPGPPGSLSLCPAPPFSPGRRSTARWTRAPRPRAGRRPPTTTRSWACTTPKTTSLSERQVGAGHRGGGGHPGEGGGERAHPTQGPQGDVGRSVTSQKEKGI